MEDLKFYSFEDLKKFVAKKEETDCIQLCIENSRTVDGARRRGLKRNINEKLKYYELKYRCIHSCIPKNKSTGKRPNQWTFKQDCPFLLRFSLSEDGQSLVIQKCIDEHNHAHNKETAKLLPSRLGKVSNEIRRLVRIRSSKVKALKRPLLWSVEQQSVDSRKPEKLYRPGSEKLFVKQPVERINQSTVEEEKELPNYEKYQIVTYTTQKLAFLVSDSPLDLFHKRLTVLENIMKCWEKNIDLEVSGFEEVTSSTLDSFSPDLDDEETNMDYIEFKMEDDETEPNLPYIEEMYKDMPYDEDSIGDIENISDTESDVSQDSGCLKTEETVVCQPINGLSSNSSQIHNVKKLGTILTQSNESKQTHHQSRESNGKQFKNPKEIIIIKSESDLENLIFKPSKEMQERLKNKSKTPVLIKFPKI